VKASEPIEMTEEMKRRFREYWTVEYENYAVAEDHLNVSKPISTQASV
jgi:formylmethanofuran dehydrogenase subunit A